MIHTTLLLTRHGQTIDNMNQIMQGQTQGQLTAEGVKQAEALALQMAQRPIDAFVSSDLKRVASLRCHIMPRCRPRLCCVSATGAALRAALSPT